MPAMITSTEIFSNPQVVDIRIGEGDERKPIERLRRVELWKLADMFNIDYPAGATKDHMLLLMQGAQASGVDFTRPPKPVVAEPQAEIAEMTFGELRRAVKAKGGSWSPRDKKEDLIGKLAALDG